jgi:hypothetical protein
MSSHTKLERRKQDFSARETTICLKLSCLFLSLLQFILELNAGLYDFIPESELLDEIQTKVLRVFLLAIQIRLISFVLRLYFSKLTQPLTASKKEKGGKHDRNPPPHLPVGLRIHSETASPRTLMIMPSKINEVVRS